MPFSVIVNVWGPARYKEAGYDWVPIGKIDAEKIDFDFLKEKTMDMINKHEYKPVVNAARLEIVKDGEKAMKVMLMDLW